jgi:large subunit ribosomal protein L28
MARKCEVCGKTTAFGRNIRHQSGGKWERKAPRTNRMFRANVQTKSLTINGETRRFHICTRCIRTQSKVAR